MVLHPGLGRTPMPTCDFLFQFVVVDFSILLNLLFEFARCLLMPVDSCRLRLICYDCQIFLHVLSQIHEFHMKSFDFLLISHDFHEIVTFALRSLNAHALFLISVDDL